MNQPVTSTTQKPYPTPSIAWLSITNYMHQWLFNQYGGAIALYGKPICTIHHIPGVRNILRMETIEDNMQPGPVNKWSMSAMRMDCMQLGLSLGPKSMEEVYGITSEQMQTYIPIECPRMALTKYGVLRPWNRLTGFGRAQASELVKLLRNLFWQSVRDYNQKLISEGIAPDTAIEMIEGYCADNNIGQLYLDDLRREWQRLVSINHPSVCKL